MKLGKKFRKILILTIFLIPYSLLGENKIVTSPLLNLDKLKPSFENLEEKNDNLDAKKNLKNKKNIKKIINYHMLF